MSSCMQYYYNDKEESDNNKISCERKVFTDLESPEKFTNKKLLEFVDNNFGSKAFPNAEKSPFEFPNDYIDESHDKICNATSFSLTPQQKFCGQFINPSTNFKSGLIYHGLGSGKTCTSIVIGEAFKNASSQRILYVVPAPLVNQYFEEILGELRNNEIWSCTSQCVFKSGGDVVRDFYTNLDDRLVLEAKIKALEKARVILDDLQKQIDSDVPDKAIIVKKHSSQSIKVATLTNGLLAFQQELKSKAVKVFEIVSQPSFINTLYQTTKDGHYVKKDRLTKDNVLLNKNGVLIIDEIQRLVSAGGVYYKKLYNAIKYYCHPELRIVLLSATPIYDNPYELALTINLLRPRIPFPINKDDFYKFFVGDYDKEKGCIKSDKPWISDNSCVINHEIVRYLCAGYVSYFRGGNPVAYPYKRVITMEHTFQVFQKAEYISALESDIKKDKNFTSGSGGFSDEIILGNYDTDKDDKISGIYVTTQQYSNIALPRAMAADITLTIDTKKQTLLRFRDELSSFNFKTPDEVVEYIRLKGYSNKFASIIELSNKSNGPVFIFSNWLQYGVESLSIILDACGYVRYPKPGEKRYFIWSSETKTTLGDEVIKKARNLFNSVENKNGSLLKIILGTRSVMEGVSFKNVREVHITDPWWNEARIEQILARAVRFCSHKALPIDEQIVDVYRHYSVLPGGGSVPDIDVVEMLRKSGRGSFKNFESFSIDQKMSIAAIKKTQINAEFEEILKSVAVDANLNKNGNLIRLEEYAKPISNGKYQVYFRNPSTFENYIREGIPQDGITFEELYTRKYSYPNDSDLPVIFKESVIDSMGEKFIPEGETLKEPEINKSLVLYEDIKPWESDKTFNELDGDKETLVYLKNLYQSFMLVPRIRGAYFGEKGRDKINFKESPVKLRTLIDCIKELSERNLVTKKIKRDIVKKFNSEKIKKKMNKKVQDLIYVHGLFPESYLENLYELAVANPDAINELLKTVN